MFEYERKGNIKKLILLLNILINYKKKEGEVRIDIMKYSNPCPSSPNFIKLQKNLRKI